MALRTLILLLTFSSISFGAETDPILPSQTSINRYDETATSAEPEQPCFYRMHELLETPKFILRTLSGIFLIAGGTLLIVYAVGYATDVKHPPEFNTTSQLRQWELSACPQADPVWYWYTLNGNTTYAMAGQCDSPECEYMVKVVNESLPKLAETCKDLFYFTKDNIRYCLACYPADRFINGYICNFNAYFYSRFIFKTTALSLPLLSMGSLIALVDGVYHGCGGVCRKLAERIAALRQKLTKSSDAEPSSNGQVLDDTFEDNAYAMDPSASSD